MKKNISNNIKNLEVFYDKGYDITVDYNSIVNRATNNRNISIAVGLLTAGFAGAIFTITRDNILNGLDVFTIATVSTSIISFGAAIIDQNTINKEKKRKYYDKRKGSKFSK